MTRFENFKNMNIDELAEWFDQHGDINNTCDTWFEETYCQNCDRVTKDNNDYAYCELNDDCKMHPGHNVTKNNIYVIKMWLSEEVIENNA